MSEDEVTPATPASEGAVVILRYVGRGEFFHGVPARDLSARDCETLTLEQLEQALDSGLYVRADMSADISWDAQVPMFRTGAPAETEADETSKASKE